MKTVSSSQMREIDRLTAERLGIKTEQLMEDAGRGTAEIALRLTQEYGKPNVLMIAGRGNNGGDVFAAAVYLKKMGVVPEVWLAGDAKETRGDALTWLGKMKAAHIPLKTLPTKEDWDHTSETFCDAYDPGYDLVVDGILGTGIQGPARGPAAGAISLVNRLSRHAAVLSVDVPSGLDSDTGETGGEAVFADVTATMGLPKRGLLMPTALAHVGNIEVVDIGVPDELIEEIESDIELVTDCDLRRLLPRRPAASHKGDHGRLLVVAGSSEYPGAAVMAVRAGLRSGAGLVTAMAPRRVADALAAVAPEATALPAAETDVGSLSRKNLEIPDLFGGEFTAVVLGPGMGRHPDTGFIVRAFLEKCRSPMLLDADALNALEGDIASLAKARAPVTITPHPGEMSRLLGKKTTDVQSDRFGAARLAAEKSGAVVVLKGAGTIIAKTGMPLAVNLSGNAGMAKGGMGDVLAGFAGGLLAQGLAPYDAARIAVFLHGKAGDETARMKSQHGMTAGDVAAALPGAFRHIVPR